jgi:rhamnosyltransferase
MLSVVIPTKNGGPLFKQLLHELEAQSFKSEVEILVVDSGSTDGTLEAAERSGFRTVRIPPDQFNHGLTRNRGVESSQGDIVVLMTQDALPANADLLSALAEPFHDPEVAGVFARQVARSDADAITRRDLDGWVTGTTRREIRQIDDRAEYDRLSPMERYRFCTFDNVCSAVRRTAWEQIPFPAANFGEDIEWGRRALEAGWKIVYEPQAVVVHSHRRSPIYEYRRTYICHRRLYQLFGLETVPGFRHALRNMAAGILRDGKYILKNVPGPIGKVAQLLRMPFLTSASVWAQYLGARDEKRRRTNRVKPV